VSARSRALVVCLVVIALDQISKAIIRSSLATGHHTGSFLGFRIAHAKNTGVAFGFLGGGGALVIAITVFVLALVVVWFWRNPDRPGLWLATGLIAGGAIGNLIDRIRIGSVTDFIDPPLWPTFNVADMAITLGAIIIVLVTLGAEQHQQRSP
jgi:signal peptidase II